MENNSDVSSTGSNSPKEISSDEVEEISLEEFQKSANRNRLFDHELFGLPPEPNFSQGHGGPFLKEPGWHRGNGEFSAWMGGLLEPMYGTLIGGPLQMPTGPGGGSSSQKRPDEPDVFYVLGGPKNPKIDGALQRRCATAGDPIPGKGRGVQAAGTVGSKSGPSSVTGKPGSPKGHGDGQIQDQGRGAPSWRP